jgi:phosphoglycerate dehydrogenase-like enzyme
VHSDQGHGVIAANLGCVKIGFLHYKIPLMDVVTERLRVRLAGHEFSAWSVGDAPAARDLDLLLVIGDVPRDVLEAQPKLALVQTATAGYDGIDIDAATELGIWVSYAPAAETGNAVSVAEMAILLMLAAARNLNRATLSLRDRSQRATRLNRALYGKSVCIVGYGGIGRELATRLVAFGNRVTTVDKHPERVPEHIEYFAAADLKLAIADADFVVVAVPATKANENLFDANVIAAMKHGAILVNVARGMLVDEDALRAAVSEGRLYAAGLDVVRHEPVGPTEPLLEHPEIFITPHIAGATDLMIDGTIDFLASVVDGVAAGRKPHSVLNDPPAPRLVFETRA